MTDRELLQLAAKAAGLDLKWCEPWKCMAKLCADETFAHNSQWNSLVDDGDALRLAVKVLNWPHIGRAFEQQVTAMYAVGKLPEDPYAATRLAITRAAAEIGRIMK